MLIVTCTFFSFKLHSYLHCYHHVSSVLIDTLLKILVIACLEFTFWTLWPQIDFKALMMMIVEHTLFSFFLFPPDVSGIHRKDFFAMLRDLVHISSAWHHFYGLQQLHSPFIVLLLDTKRMLKTWGLCFTCMFGVCIMFILELINFI